MTKKQREDRARRWREYVRYKIGWSDPCDARLQNIEEAFKMAYEFGIRDTIKCDHDFKPLYSHGELEICEKCGMTKEVEKSNEE